MRETQPCTIDVNGPQWLALHIDIAGIGARDLVRWFVDPALLARWWTDDANVEPGVGGRWELRWPAMDWVLSGQIADVTPVSLVVSWTWMHEPALPARALIVRSEPITDGATLHILQGPYRQGDAFPNEDTDRASHLAGWEHFLPKLRDAITASIHPPPPASRAGQTRS